MNFDLGGYLLQNGIAGLLIEEEKWNYYSWIGKWISFKIKYTFLSNDQFKTSKKANKRVYTYYFEQYRYPTMTQPLLQLPLGRPSSWVWVWTLFCDWLRVWTRFLNICLISSVAFLSIDSIKQAMVYRSEFWISCARWRHSLHLHANIKSRSQLTNIQSINTPTQSFYKSL